MSLEAKQILKQKNKLLRYKLIKELYNKHKNEDIPTTVVLRKYIYPVYPISRTTLYEILCTPVMTLLKEIEQLEKINSI
jgi:hypothetical protein